MAVFEKDKASRRYYSQATDPWPSPPGGVPTGSIVHHLDDGSKFIYDGQTWRSWSEEADIIEALKDVGQAIYELLPHIRVIRAATATTANVQTGSEFSTDDE